MIGFTWRMGQMAAVALAMALAMAATAMAATPPKVFDAHDGGLWLFEAKDLPPLMLTLRLSEKPEPETRDGFWKSVREAAEAGKKLFVPPLRLCGDNGAMIGAQGYYEYLAGARAGSDLNAYATMDL